MIAIDTNFLAADVSIILRGLESLSARDQMIAGLLVAAIGVGLVTWFARQMDARDGRWPVLFWVASFQAVVFVIGFPLANPYLGLLPRNYELLVPFGSILLAVVLLKAFAPGGRPSTENQDVPPLARRCDSCNRVLPEGTDTCPQCDVYVPPLS